ncbi:phosphofructokinase [Niastella koreensis]|uniref:1-phosphofructokinase n=2 Tax=Niastella koreensis TaxID=354356 RepID=G8TBU2_NIAKG|nr:1-phosphofructokinase family hexose kinase [Niastella koreensis]AEV98224.1 1-phosphofructokinase [Niastella koreensis GR20-10]OQP44332.1 phosphofructokinase [Niastella koreensis]
MIITITMNPAVDKSTTINKLVAEKKMRCSEMVTEAGGGGINVSKALKELGSDSLAVFPSGGINGQLIEKYLQARDIPYQTIPIEKETRENIVVRENDTNLQYRFVMPGASLTEREAQLCLQMIQQLQPAPDYIVASGSLPPGLPEHFFASLAKTAKQVHARFIIDTSGLPLQLAAKEGVYLLKPNLSELCALAGVSYLPVNEVKDAALKVIKQQQCEVMVVSMGPEGALLVTHNGYEPVPAPTVKKQSTVGAGDSMVAGMVFMLSQGRSLPETVRFGVACGTAATMNPGTQLFKKEDVYQLYHRIS